jgi:hypothetical protein
MRPHSLVIRTYAARGAWLWIAIRSLLTCAILLGGGDPTRVTAMIAMGIVLTSIGAGFIDTLRRRERALLRNLALTPAFLALIFAGPAIVGEAAIRIVRAALA